MRKKGIYIQNIATKNSAFLVLLLLVLQVVPGSKLYAQSTIATITVTETAATDSDSEVRASSDRGQDITANVEYNILYGRGNNVTVDSYTVTGIGTPFDNFVFPDTLMLRRTDGSRTVNIWYTIIDDANTPNGFNTLATPIEISLQAEEVTEPDAIYLSRNVNAGYDNVLVNDDDVNVNIDSPIQAQVERVDVIWRTGIVTCDVNNAVFPVIERGGNDQIKIAAILSLDENGDPATYSTLIDIEDSDWPGGETQGQLYDNFLVLRRQTAGEAPFPLVNFGEDTAVDGDQLVQGVAVTFNEFGILNNQVVYGYSLFAFDVNTTDHTLTDITTFPTNTKSSDSGLDLVAGVSAAVANDDCLTPATGPGGYKQALATWLKANESADITSSSMDGDAVSDWQDHWLGNHDATTGVATPTYRNTTSTINFNPTVDFTTSNTSLDIADNTDFNTATSYTNKGLNIAFRTDTDISTRQVLYEQGGNDKGIIIYIESSNINVSAWNRTSDGTGAPWNNSTTIDVITASVAADTEYIVTLEQAGNTGITGTLTAYLNGASFGPLNNVGILFNHTDDIQFGASDGSTQYDDGTDASNNSFDGEISELIYCNEPSNFLLSQRNRIESYLAVKYGITLDQTSPYDYVDSDGNVIFDATNNASTGGYLEFNMDIAGIGRDDGSELSQVKSKSENANSIVTMDKGTTFGTDDTYLLWGNDGGATTTQTSDVPPLIEDRLTREWRVAEEKESGEVSVTFDITGLSLGTEASDFSLLVAASDSDNSFANATIITGGSLNGNELTFTGVDFQDGEYFTLGTAFIDCAPGNVTTGLSLWLKADLGPDVITNGSDVNTWEDKAGSNDATAPVGSEPNYATNVANFNPALNFEGVNNDGGVDDEEVNGTSGFYSTAYYAVIIPDGLTQTTGSTEVPIGFGAPGGTTDLACLCIGPATSDFSGELVTHAIGNGTPEWRKGISSSYVPSLTGDVPRLISVQDNATADNTDMFLEGQEADDLTGGGGGNQFLSSLDQDYTLGNWNVASSFNRDYDGKIAEVISYSTRPGVADHAKIQSYLAIKYGISLSNDVDDDGTVNEVLSGSLNEGDYVASNGTTFPWKYDASYRNNVAGIGRDDNSCLNQKQSGSRDVDGDAIVAIGLESIAATNEENTNSFDADLTFLMWANDSASTTFAGRTQSVTGIGNVTDRMTRIWHVEETGTVGETSVSFDLAGLGFTSDASDFTFIQSASASLTSPTTYTNGTFNGDVLTFTGINFNDEDYFTLGTAVSACGPGGVTTDLALWHKANLGTSTTTDGADMSTWDDQSTNNTPAGLKDLGGFTVAEPTFETSEINFNPIIRFVAPGSTNSSWLQSPINNVDDDFTLIAVFQTGQNSGTQGDIDQSPTIIGAETDKNGGEDDYGLVMESGQLALNASTGNGFDVETTNTFNDNYPHIVTATRVQSTGALAIFVEGNSEGTGTGASGVSLADSDSLGIGNQPGNQFGADVASQFNGDIAEVIAFTDDLTTDERRQVESYLALKYGITLSNAAGGDAGDYDNSAGTTVWDASALSTYHNDIASLSRDDDSCLNQTKSKSENEDAIVTMEISALTVDDSFMLWGNDNATLQSPRNFERPTGINSRLNREWVIEERGTVGTVSITFDLSSIGGPTGVGTSNLNLVRLMTDPTDSDFRTGVTLTEPTSIDAANNTITFEFDFTDGMFYTLGSSEHDALPISLLHFGATPVDQDKVRVEWTTIQEVGNAYFDIERSTDGLNYTSIAQMDGAGDSDDIINYEYMDQNPVHGRSFYRLKQTDFNGEFDYSEVASIYLDLNRPDFIMSLFPNPVEAGQPIHISYDIDHDKRTLIDIVNANGSILHSEERLLIATEDHIVISTGGLRKGLHIIRIMDESQRVVSLKVLIH